MIGKLWKESLRLVQNESPELNSDDCGWSGVAPAALRRTCRHNQRTLRMRYSYSIRKGRRHKEETIVVVAGWIG